MNVIIKTKEIKSLEVNELSPTSPLGKDLAKELGIDIGKHYRIEEIRMEDGFAIKRLFVNGEEAIRNEEFGRMFFIPKTTIGEDALIEAELAPAYKVTRGSGEEAFSWFYQEGEETLEVLCMPTRASVLKEVKIEREDGVDDLTLDDYLCKKTPYQEYWLTFKMPPHNIRITPIFEEDDSFASLTINTRAILDLEYSSIRGCNISCTSIVTDAVYSDDYDFDCVDHHFDESPIKFKKGSTLRVELALHKEAIVILRYAGKEYRPLNYERRVVTDDSRLKERVIYVYHYKNLPFSGNSTMTFVKKEGQ